MATGQYNSGFTRLRYIEIYALMVDKVPLEDGLNEPFLLLKQYSEGKQSNAVIY